MAVLIEESGHSDTDENTRVSELFRGRRAELVTALMCIGIQLGLDVHSWDEGIVSFAEDTPVHELANRLRAWKANVVSLEEAK